MKRLMKEIQLYGDNSEVEAKQMLTMIEGRLLDFYQVEDSMPIDGDDS
ncbi:hypothetical protein QA612_17690 [Evansella sp. AB-P1]|nr:hypothetical protein [Evansella sp. AB-P1]MDG5789296.1 hypothetical protein [Evansella sp. AB-P1]